MMMGVSSVIALAGGGCLLRRGRACGWGSGSCCLTTEPPALARRGMAFGLAAAGPTLLAAAAFLVDRRPGAALGPLLRNATGLIALGYVVGLAFLLVGVDRKSGV